MIFDRNEKKEVIALLGAGSMGTAIVRRIAENLEAANVELTEEEFAALEGSLNGLKVYGHRGLGGF